MHEPKIIFHFQNTSISFIKRKKLRSLIIAIIKNERKKLLTLSYVFCSDKYLLKINQKFLLHDYYTDIITFNLSESENIVGEIYISTERIRENAKLFNITLKQELFRVIIHGVLHLCGYNDKTKREKKIMVSKEEFYLSQWGKNTHFT